MTKLSAEKLVLALALDRAQTGTRLAGAYVDTDGTATTQLLERRPDGWYNATTQRPTSAPEIAARFDDIVTTLLPPTEDQIRAAALAMYRLTTQLSMSGAIDLARAALAAVSTW